MTRAAKSPVTRVVQGESEQEYTVTVKGKILEMRPLGSRQMDATIIVTWDSLYQRALLNRVAKPAKVRRVVSRGLLATQRRAE